MPRDQYRIVDAFPTPAQYRALREAAGLSPRTAEQAGGVAAGSWAFRTALDGDRPVGMGRVIGDGSWYFLIADMAVLPEHQGRGIGAAILDGLIDEIARRAPAGAYVTLTADPPGRRLYRSRGFEDVAPDRTGMHRVLGGRRPGAG